MDFTRSAVFFQDFEVTVAITLAYSAIDSANQLCMYLFIDVLLKIVKLLL